jgi:uncharacterized phage protein (TIGR02218 family)
MGFTDHDRDIEFDGVIHQAASGFDGSAVNEGIGLEPGGSELAGALQSDHITWEDVRRRRYDGARIEHYVVNWSSPEEHVLMRTFMMGEISREDGLLKAEVKPLTALLDQSTGRRFRRKCNADLGDARCGIDLSSMRDSAIVIEMQPLGGLVVSGLDHREQGWFRAGRVEFTSGDAAGFSVEVADHAVLQADSGTVKTVLHLWEVPEFEVFPGDGINVTPGCDKQYATCKARFDNGVNFQGFPHMPGTEFALSYASNSAQMDGGPLIP